MNTNNLKRFAKEARIKLLDQVGRKLEFVLTHDTAELRGKHQEIEQLKKKIAEQSQEQVIEMVAYTWFNRLMALRFMDANGYTIPKVITALEGMTNPEILQNALGGTIEPELKLDRQRLNDLLDGKTSATDAHTEAYKMLLVASCNQWHTAMPFMFERISDYTELLLPDDLLSDYSIVADIRNGMSEEDCQQEELIGWLYQFYIADKKDDVFEGLKKNIKITAKNIPAATQLFTPRWIVRYMVENTLGKLWLSLKPNSKLRQFMPYYIEAPEGNAPAQLPDGIKGVTDITFLDPCQGSGHVLVYAFDLFTKIYEEEGYNTNEIPALILEHNLFGIDIDERAAQLAAFALTMKARSYYPRFLRKPVQPHVIALENVNEDIIKQAVKLPLAVAGKLVYDYRDLTLYNLTQADNFGSLIQIDPEELKALQIQKGSIWQEQELKLKEQAEYLSRQYHCVVTNPPYMGGGGMNESLRVFITKNYNEGKSDLMTCFMQRCGDLIHKKCRYGLINLPSWLSLSSFKDLRKELLEKYHIESMVHMGRGIFGIDFGSVAFVISKENSNLKSSYFRLYQRNFQHIYFYHIEMLFLRVKANNLYKYDFTSYREQEGAIEIPENSDEKGLKLYFEANQNDFCKIPGNPIVYWLGENVIKLFERNKLSKLFVGKEGIGTRDDGRFLRSWWEISQRNIGINKKWIKTDKAGGFRKWYGNLNVVMNWENNGFEIKNFKDEKGKLRSRPQNIQYLFKEAIGWGKVSAGIPSFRMRYEGLGFNDAAPSLFGDNDKLVPLGFLNSKVAQFLIRASGDTINYTVGTIESLPYIEIEDDSTLSKLCNECIAITREDWDSYETSWDFSQNKIIKHSQSSIKSSFQSYKDVSSKNFNILHQSEEELNRQFINIYKLQNELTPDVPLEEITILQEESKIVNGELFIDPIPVLLQLFSYSVSCLFGRYSLNNPGLILANQGDTLPDFLKQVPNPIFMPDEDNIIPVLDGEWFIDDIVGGFKMFLKAAFGEGHFEDNLKYIEETIGKDIRKYFVKDFYNDHIKRYKKRPIYWMFSSPKGHFKALIYMHRYQPDLCSKMLNDYLQAFISKLEATKQTQTMLSLREDISAREKTLAIKEIDKYEVMLKDCREYEKTLFAIATQKISIDLDDGVKVNYQKFKEVLVPIKGLEKEEE